MRKMLIRLAVFMLVMVAFGGLGSFHSCVAAAKVDDENGAEAMMATLSATPNPTPLITSVPKSDLTQPTESKSRLENLLDSQEVRGNWLQNFLKLGIRKAVDGGVPANTIVLLLLFPLVAVLVAFSRNVVGINGFGIFTPAVVAVAFLATGISAGLILFFAIMATATLARFLVRRIALPYLPRMAFLIWFVSLSILGLLVLASSLKMTTLISLGIFPILLFILLAETFIDVQITRTLDAAALMTFETMVLALIAFFLMSSHGVQEMVLLHPEVSVLVILLADILIGKYTGLRILEIWRFRGLIKTVK